MINILKGIYIVPRTSLYKKEYNIQVYNLARMGLREKDIARKFGVTLATFRLWRKKKTIFRKYYRKGRNEYKGRGVEPFSFRDYIYDKLPLDLRYVWNKINRIEKLKGGRDKIEALLEEGGKRVRQHLFIFAWTQSNFSVSRAMSKVNLSRSTFNAWKIDPEFAKLVEEIDTIKGDFLEEHLYKLVGAGDTSATIHANKTFNRNRGYGDKLDLRVSGELDSVVMTLSELELPIEVRKELLKAMRKNKKKEILDS